MNNMNKTDEVLSCSSAGIVLYSKRDTRELVATCVTCGATFVIGSIEEIPNCFLVFLLDACQESS